MSLKSTQIVYSEHHYDECFEYINGKGRVPEGEAIGYTASLMHCNDEWVPTSIEIKNCDTMEKLILFDDIKYSKYDHKYWDNYELEQDSDRIVIP